MKKSKEGPANIYVRYVCMCIYVHTHRYVCVYIHMYTYNEDKIGMV